MYSWPIPRDDAVGSKEQLPPSRARVHASTVAAMVVVRRIKAVTAVVTTRPLLKGRIIVNAVRSAESAVSSCSRVKASKLYAKLRLQPNAVAMADVEMTSIGTTTELGISKCRMTLATKTTRLVMNATEP
jgi:hypothetical protein